MIIQRTVWLVSVRNVQQVKLLTRDKCSCENPLHPSSCAVNYAFKLINWWATKTRPLRYSNNLSILCALLLTKWFSSATPHHSCIMRKCNICTYTANISKLTFNSVLDLLKLFHPIMFVNSYYVFIYTFNTPNVCNNGLFFTLVKRNWDDCQEFRRSRRIVQIFFKMPWIWF